MYVNIYPANAWRKGVNNQVFYSEGDRLLLQGNNNYFHLLD